MHRIFPDSPCIGSPLSLFCLFFLMIPPPPRSTLFPYTTLFRSIVRKGRRVRRLERRRSATTCPRYRNYCTCARASQGAPNVRYVPHPPRGDRHLLGEDLGRQSASMPFSRSASRYPASATRLRATSVARASYPSGRAGAL